MPDAGRARTRPSRGRAPSAQECRTGQGKVVAAHRRQATGRPPNANFLFDVNVEGFFNLLTERFARLP